MLQNSGLDMTGVKASESQMQVWDNIAESPAPSVTLPLVGVVSPASSCSNVVFPAPLLPKIKPSLLAGSCRLMLSRSGTGDPAKARQHLIRLRDVCMPLAVNHEFDNLKHNLLLLQNIDSAASWRPQVAAVTCITTSLLLELLSSCVRCSI